MKKLLMSSSDPQKLSLTIRGLLVGIIPMILLFTNLTEAEINIAIDAIVQIIFWGASIVSAGQMLYGLLRKLRFKRWTAAE